ncbi:hypothetical protein BDW75DRAFT_15209 [Aspergillus navahoensis]
MSSTLSEFAFRSPRVVDLFYFLCRRCPWSIFYTPSCLDLLISNSCFQSLPGVVVGSLAAALYLPYIGTWPLDQFFFSFLFLLHCVFVCSLLASFSASEKVHLVHDSCDTVFCRPQCLFPISTCR